MSNLNPSLSLVDNPGGEISRILGPASRFFVSIGFIICGLAAAGVFSSQPSLGAILFFVTFTSALICDISGNILRKSSALQNNQVMQNSLTSKGLSAWALGVILTLFYVVLYWYGAYLKNFSAIFNDLSYFLRGKPADQWFLYGTLYTFAVLLMGVRAICKYRHSRYQIIRTSVIMIAQLFLAYLIPAFLQLMQQPEYYFSYFWPLKPEYLYPWKLNQLWSKPGAIAHFMAWWGIGMSLIGVPLLTYYFGKRWYCSWVCGCGGLANTAGDQFRHLSNKSLRAWQWERYTIHIVLVLIIGLTGLLWVNSYFQGGVLKQISQTYSKAYGFFIGALFSGVIGVGFYPIFGTRLWCRFGCPQAAILGLLQKFFSRFRITVNGGQCISCGNCSTYCEMGIDVKWYAQRGQDFARASCVGCGMCANVCPRGVLKLENSKVNIESNQGSWNERFKL